MPVDRPTFSESWYRVAELRPRLRTTIHTHRQFFRGQTWHVVQDPTSNQFFRLNEEAYRFIAMLDGRRTVSEVWRVTNEQLGDRAPTQGEAIQLLGQLYTSNLLQCDLPPDAEGLLRRYRQRVTREVQGYLTNLLFIRIPLLDPDRFLDWFVGLAGLAFTWGGLVVWLVLLAAGLYSIAGRTGELIDRAPDLLDPASLPLLYASFVLIKIIHELGHGFACKKFGRADGTGGEVHVLGLMFLVFTPLPYVDASSSWAFRSKWHRIVVGAAGMMVELGGAAIAAIVWANTREGTALHAIAYNAVFIGSISTLLFNGNPLLRYDGYYILSDLLEIPNLAQRSRDYLYYLVRKYAWGVRKVRNPAHSPGEAAWMAVYAVSSTIYRVFISIAILLFVASALPFLGIILATVAVIAWGLVPLCKLIYYLFSSAELIRVRTRAVGSSLVVMGGIVAAVGFLPLPDPVYLDGVVEPREMKIIHAGADGFLTDHLPSGQPATPDGRPLARTVNPELDAQQKGLEAERRRLVARRNLAQTEEPAAAQIIDEQIQALDDQILRVVEQLSLLTIRAPVAGTWYAPDIDLRGGAYLRRGDRIGLVGTLDDMIVRAVAGQEVAGLLIREAAPDVEMRINKRPDLALAGRIKQFLPAGSERLPSPALSYQAGGHTAVAADDRSGTKTIERIFEIQLAPDRASATPLFAGQRVVIRFETAPKPVVARVWRWILQMVQRRFRS